MTSTTERIKVAPRIELFPPTGEPLVLEDVRLETEFDGEVIREVRLIGWLAPDAWRRVDDGGWFHLAPDVRGPTFAGGFDPDARIEIEARLDAEVLTLEAVLNEDDFEIAARLLGASPDARVRSTEAWWGLYVKQQRGPIKTGFATRHSELLAPTDA